MTVPLSDMSREALVRELRIARARGDSDRAMRVRLALYRKDHPPKPPELPPAPKQWWQED